MQHPPRGFDPDERVLRGLQKQRDQEEHAEKIQRERTDEALLVLETLAQECGGRKAALAVRTVRVEIHRLRRRVDVA